VYVRAHAITGAMERGAHLLAQLHGCVVPVKIYMGCHEALSSESRQRDQLRLSEGTKGKWGVNERWSSLRLGGKRGRRP